MIAYGIGVLPLIQELWDAHPRVTQPWYDDDTGAGGGVQGRAIALPRPSGEGISPGLLTGADQEYLGRGPRERCPGRGTLQGTRHTGGDGAPVIWRLPGRHCGRKGVVREKVKGTEGVGAHTGRGRP